MNINQIILSTWRDWPWLDFDVIFNTQLKHKLKKKYERNKKLATVEIFFFAGSESAHDWRLICDATAAALNWRRQTAASRNVRFQFHFLLSVLQFSHSSVYAVDSFLPQPAASTVDSKVAKSSQKIRKIKFIFSSKVELARSRCGYQQMEIFLS